VTERPSAAPLVLIGMRCVARYVLSPFALPFLVIATGPTRGIVTGAALGVLLILDVLAICSIVIGVRRLWRHQYPRRRQYLAVAGC
jgi:hypothetical protein